MGSSVQDRKTGGSQEYSQVGGLQYASRHRQWPQPCLTRCCMLVREPAGGKGSTCWLAFNTTAVHINAPWPASRCAALCAVSLPLPWPVLQAPFHLMRVPWSWWLTWMAQCCAGRGLATGQCSCQAHCGISHAVLPCKHAWQAGRQHGARHTRLAQIWLWCRSAFCGFCASSCCCIVGTG